MRAITRVIAFGSLHVSGRGEDAVVVAKSVERPLVPFNRSTYSGMELAYVRQVIESGQTAGNGPFGRQAEAVLSAMHSAPTLTTTSCTHSLELAARLIDLKKDDEVIVPSYTFVSTASAFLWGGAKPVFADSRPDTLNIDPQHVKSLITNRTRAICIVHYGGVGADPDVFSELAKANGLVLVEDNAHGLGGSYAGKLLGTFGAMSTLSFHGTKNVSCGEGGAIVLNDTNFLERAEILREKGTDRSRFLRGQVDKYTWVDSGSSWVLSDILAAVLVAQLEDFESMQAARMSIWRSYRDALSEWALTCGIGLPHIPDDAIHTAHMFHLRMPNLDTRDAFIEHLLARNVNAVFHYQALHESPMAKEIGSDSHCPVAAEAARTLVRLPLYNGMSQAEQNQVIDSVVSFRG